MSDSDAADSLLAAAAKHASVGPFFAEILPEVRSWTSAAGAAVVRSTPPRWQFVAGSGVAEGQAPAELSGDALDRNRATSAGEWSATPLVENFVLLVRRAAKPATLEEVGRRVAAALGVVHGRQQAEGRLKRLETILEITDASQQKTSIESLLKSMAEAAAKLLAADRSSIFLWDKPNKQLVARPALGVKGNELRIPDDTGIVGQVIHTGEPRRVGGGVGEDQIARGVDKATGYTTKSLLCVPLATPAGKVLGAFEVLNKRDGQFTDEDERGLAEFAAHAAVALHNTQEFADLVAKNRRLVEQAAQGVELVGESPAIEALQSTIRRIADTDLAILILGENGAGKEVVARSIHYLSRRRDLPFIAVNCASLAETLLESELFGHEKGAFTDARETRQGKFELASGGTLFLDEIGDMSLAGQAKLLRVLEDKTVVRVGGSTPIHTEVRVLAATNQNLAEMVRAKRFREDLFYRLNVVSLELPPLRQRGNDVLLLAEHFGATFCKTMGRKPLKFSPAARKRLMEHAWPGNVRELRNLCERLAYLTTGDTVEPHDLAIINADAADDATRFTLDQSLADATRRFQQEYVRRMIDASRGNMTTAAGKLGLHRSNLYRKMKQLEMPTDGLAELE